MTAPWVFRCFPSHTCYVCRSTVSGMAKDGEKKVATAWGDARVVEEARVEQSAGSRRFASVVELLEGEKGERLVRFAYTTDGVARRGPVTLRVADVAKLRKALDKRPLLAETLRLGNGAGGG